MLTLHFPCTFTHSSSCRRLAVFFASGQVDFYQHFLSCQGIQFPPGSPPLWAPEPWVPSAGQSKPLQKPVTFDSLHLHTRVNWEKNGLVPAVGHLAPCCSTLERPLMEMAREEEQSQPELQEEGTAPAPSVAKEHLPLHHLHPSVPFKSCCMLMLLFAQAGLCTRLGI